MRTTSAPVVCSAAAAAKVWRLAASAKPLSPLQHSCDKCSKPLVADEFSPVAATATMPADLRHRYAGRQHPLPGMRHLIAHHAWAAETINSGARFCNHCGASPLAELNRYDQQQQRRHDGACSIASSLLLTVAIMAAASPLLSGGIRSLTALGALLLAETAAWLYIVQLRPRRLPGFHRDCLIRLRCGGLLAGRYPWRFPYLPARRLLSVHASAAASGGGCCRRRALFCRMRIFAVQKSGNMPTDIRWNELLDAALLAKDKLRLWEGNDRQMLERELEGLVDTIRYSDPADAYRPRGDGIYAPNRPSPADESIQSGSGQRPEEQVVAARNIRRKMMELGTEVKQRNRQLAASKGSGGDIMRVLGIILIVIGILVAVCLMLPTVLVILLSPSKPESIAVGVALAFIMTGLPHICSSTSGANLTAKGTPSPRRRHRYQGAEAESRLGGALTPLPSSTRRRSAAPIRRSGRRCRPKRMLRLGAPRHRNRKPVVSSGEAPQQRTEQPRKQPAAPPKSAPPPPPPPPPPVPKTVSCKGCGASKNNERTKATPVFAIRF